MAPRQCANVAREGSPCTGTCCPKGMVGCAGFSRFAGFRAGENARLVPSIMYVWPSTLRLEVGGPLLPSNASAADGTTAWPAKCGRLQGGVVAEAPGSPAPGDRWPL